MPIEEVIQKQYEEKIKRLELFKSIFEHISKEFTLKKVTVHNYQLIFHHKTDLGVKLSLFFPSDLLTRDEFITYIDELSYNTMQSRGAYNKGMR